MDSDLRVFASGFRKAKFLPKFMNIEFHDSRIYPPIVHIEPAFRITAVLQIGKKYF